MYYSYSFYEFLPFVVVAILIYFAVRLSKLSDRVSHIERYLQQATVAPGNVTEQTVPEAADRQETVVPAVSPAAVPLVRSDADVFGHFAAWCREDWLMKLGGLFVLLGMAWFVSYAFAQNWIGPMGRVCLGFLAGAGVLALGYYRIVRYRTQGSVLMFVGAATIVLTTYAGRELYDFFDQQTALVLMFFTSCTLGAAAVTLRYRPLAYANMALAGLAPLLVSTGTPNMVGLHAYLMVLTLGAVWVAVATGWRSLILVSVGIVSFYSVPFAWNVWGSEADQGLLFAFAFAALFFVTSGAGMRMSPKMRISDLVVAVLSGIYLLVWVRNAAPDEWQSMLLLVWTLALAFGAFLAVRYGADRAYFYAYAGVGVVYIGVATSLLLEGPTLAVAAIIEAALLLALGYHITRDVRVVPVLALPSCVPIVLSFGSITSNAWSYARYYGGPEYGVSSTSSWYIRVFHADALVLTLMLAVPCALGAYFYAERLRDARGSEVLHKTAAVLWGVAGLYAAVLVWLTAHAVWYGDRGTTVALCVYALIGSWCFMHGRRMGSAWQRVVGNILIGFVAVRLLLVEVWDMALAGRVVTFLTVGALLITVAWLERNGRTPEHSAKPTR